MARQRHHRGGVEFGNLFGNLVRHWHPLSPSTRRTPAKFTAAIVAAAGLPLSGCGGPFSTLDPAGASAHAIAELWWVMLIGAVVLFALVMGLLLWTFVKRPGSAGASPKFWLVGGGLVLPAVVLTPLLIYALFTGERLLAHPRADDVLRIDAVAKQWQWTFTYADAGDGRRVSVNALHIPAGRPVDIRVTSMDVIHGFWVPRLGGKIDAIPGHTNVIRISAAQPGTFRGVSAEFSGTGYTDMEFSVVAHPNETYRDALRSATTEMP
jgi:cytochrome c oxidase subunit 2